ncbi:MAG: sulfotransferase [bacterium]
MGNIPYFELGAARSGTKILRDTLEAHPGFTTTNYPLDDEIWSYGQEDAPHDAFPPESLTDDIERHVRSEFEKRMGGDIQFIEKNVNHSLRIPYISEIYQDTKFIHIIRDGRDCIRSTREMWKHPIDWKYYVTSKGWELSPTTIVFYMFRLGGKFLKRLFTGSDRVDYWGIKVPELADMVQNKPLLEVCALQWEVAVNKAREDGRELPEDRYFELRYETLMKSPEEVLPDLAEFLEFPDVDPMMEFAQKQYRTSSIGKWREVLTEQEQQRIHDEVGSTLEDLGYEL